MNKLGCLALAGLALLAPDGRAHYHMLLPHSASVRKGEEVRLVFQWGHPFEHELFDAVVPESLLVMMPGGKKAGDLTTRLEKISVPAAKGKKAAAYQLRFTPEERGDYVFVATTPPVWMEEEKEWWQDVVKVVLHVQAQKGWDAAVHADRPDFEWLPLTRPYGLQPGMVFQAQIKVPPVVDPKILEQELRTTSGELGRKPRPLVGLEGGMVEVERYNDQPPSNLPPDELITRRVKTDPNGVVTTNLTEPGWWCLTVTQDAGGKERDGQRRPVRRRSTLWVFVG
jgi:uncharacterized GH25 family protein